MLKLNYVLRLAFRRKRELRNTKFVNGSKFLYELDTPIKSFGSLEVKPNARERTRVKRQKYVIYYIPYI